MAHVGSHILVTGSNRGIGLEIVQQLARLPTPPSAIFATCRNVDEAADLQKLASEYSFVKVLKLEVTSNEDRLRVAQEVGQLDILVNNAASIARESMTLEAVTEAAMLDTYKTNTVAPLMLVKALLPQLKESGKKTCGQTAIINISSLVSSIEDNSSGHMYPYRCSKVAINMVTRSLANDLKADNIACVALNPGWVQTDMGGPNAKITTAECVQQIISNILDPLSMEMSGKFISYNGTLPKW